MCKVAARWIEVDGSWQASWNWRRDPRGRGVGDLEDQMSLLKQVTLSGNEDQWYWKLMCNGRFVVEEVYFHLFKMLYGLSREVKIHFWNPLIPLKVNVHVWRAALNKLQTKDNLRSKGLVGSDKVCVLCKIVDESGLHIFFQCEKVLIVWRKVFAWWNIPFLTRIHWSSLSDLWVDLKADKVRSRAFHGACCVTIWAIWFWRNKIIFSSDAEAKKWGHEDIFSLIQRKCTLWFSTRNRKSFCIL